MAVRVVYSCVIDGHERFGRQARVFLTTLMATGVRQTQIVVHCTPAVPSTTRRWLCDVGVHVRSLEPVLDKKGCNKIDQFPALLDYAADIYVLCDADLAFAESLAPSFACDAIRAKPVDLCNPPLRILERLRLIRGLDAAPRSKTSVDGRLTWSVNFNGGLYMIPARFAARLGSTWREEAEFVFDRIGMLGRWRAHVDQVGFGLAMLRLGVSCEPLGLEYNFPLHLTRRLARLDFAPPKVLHYHDLLSQSGRLRGVGHRGVDAAVAKVNHVLCDGLR